MTAARTKQPGRVIDLDRARAARAEAKKEPVTLKFGGRDFTLPPEIPFDFAMYAAEGRLRESVGALIGDDAEAFFALRPSMPDIEALVDHARTVYGVKVGESPASAGS